jgi:hypothetical protein
MFLETLKEKQDGMKIRESLKNMLETGLSLPHIFQTLTDGRNTRTVRHYSP